MIYALHVYMLYKNAYAVVFMGYFGMTSSKLLRSFQFPMIVFCYEAVLFPHSLSKDHAPKTHPKIHLSKPRNI